MLFLRKEFTSAVLLDRSTGLVDACFLHVGYLPSTGNTVTRISLLFGQTVQKVNECWSPSVGQLLEENKRS